MLIGDILRRAATYFPDKTAIVDEATRLDYRALEAAANRFANALLSRGLAKGDVIAVLSSNRPEYAAAYFGAAKAGCVSAHLSTRATAADVKVMMELAGARLLVVEDELAALAGKACKGIAGLDHVAVIGDPAAGGIKGAIAFADLVAAESADPPAVALAETDPLAITFTGGSTGKPKAVLTSHRARYTCNVTGAVEFGVDERDLAAVALPLYHTAGLFVWYQSAVLLGLSCVFMRRWDVDEFVDKVERHGITAVMLVPTQLRDLAEHPDAGSKRLATLRTVNYAGSPIPLAVIEKARKLFPQVAFIEHLGQSETGPIAVRPPWYPPEKLGSVGRQAFGVETDVFGPDGTPVAPGDVGEVVTRGEHLLLEYYGDPAQTAALYRCGGGWLWTGDLARRDEDGCIWLVDRSKDMIISGGENIYPKEIEIALQQHPAVAECAVFGIPDERFGEAPAAHVVLRDGVGVATEELVEFCGERLARHKRLRLVEIVDALPKTAIGKIQKHLIRAPYWAGRERKI